MALRRVMSDWLIALAAWARSMALVLERAAELPGPAVDPVMAELVERYPGAPAHWLAFMAERTAAEGEMESVGAPQAQPRPAAPAQAGGTSPPQEAPKAAAERARPPSAAPVRSTSRATVSEIPSLADLAYRPTDVWSAPRTRPRGPSRPVFAPLAVSEPHARPALSGEVGPPRPSRPALRPGPNAAAQGFARQRPQDVETKPEASDRAQSDPSQEPSPAAVGQARSWFSDPSLAVRQGAEEGAILDPQLGPRPEVRAAFTGKARSFGQGKSTSSSVEDATVPARAPLPPMGQDQTGFAEAEPATSETRSAVRGPVARKAEATFREGSAAKAVRPAPRGPERVVGRRGFRTLEAVTRLLRRKPLRAAEPRLAASEVVGVSARPEAAPPYAARPNASSTLVREERLARPRRSHPAPAPGGARSAPDHAAVPSIETWSPVGRGGPPVADRGPWPAERANSSPAADRASAPRPIRPREFADRVVSVTADDRWPALPPKVFAEAPTIALPPPRWSQLIVDQEEGRWNA